MPQGIQMSQSVAISFSCLPHFLSFFLRTCTTCEMCTLLTQKNCTLSRQGSDFVVVVSNVPLNVWFLSCPAPTLKQPQQKLLAGGGVQAHGQPALLCTTLLCTDVAMENMCSFTAMTDEENNHQHEEMRSSLEVAGRGCRRTPFYCPMFWMNVCAVHLFRFSFFCHGNFFFFF